MTMKEIKSTNKGLGYLVEVLKDKKRTVTRVFFWKIPHKTSDGDIQLKIGRYKKNQGNVLELECKQPRSQLTLDRDEFSALLKFLEENYEPFKQGVNKYIPITQQSDPSNIEKVFDFIAKNNISQDDLIAGLQYRTRLKAIEEFETMLNKNLIEQKWQEWFKKNDWVLGSEFVRVLDDREIDSENITDYLMQAYDGFLDIIEIKRPDGSLKFWADSRDHKNHIPSLDLVKAITQATKYIYEVEREANSVKFLERVGNVKTIKPRCVLIYGRSYSWDDTQKEAYRILNSSYHNLTVMTYDHVLARAKRIVGLVEEEGEIPF